MSNEPTGIPTIDGDSRFAHNRPPPRRLPVSLLVIILIVILLVILL